VLVLLQTPTLHPRCRGKVPKSILIADDSDTVRHAVRVFLEKRGFTVCGEAGNGVDAIEKAQELKPDVILLDVAMPRMNGIEAVPVLKSGLPKTQIILFTMFNDSLGQSLMSALGVNAVVGKADGLTKLLERLDILLGSQPGSASDSPKAKPASRS
jgi:two-component system, chemotaxis family, chemotaxis protein CheY